MAAHGHRRQVLAFLVAIILPCVVLVALVLRMDAQERELEEGRAAEARRALTVRLRQELASRLDRIALEEAGAVVADRERVTTRRYANPAVVLVAIATDLSLVLPWERDPRPARFRRSIGREPFARLVARGERAEVGSGDPAAAIPAYAEAIAAAGDQDQATYARLLRGRASFAAGRREAAVREYTELLPSGVVDEEGVPLALYAASRLLDAGTSPSDVRTAMLRVVSDTVWLSPPALYLLRSLCPRLTAADGPGTAADADLAAAIDSRIRATESAIGLQREYPHLGLSGGGRTQRPESRWVAWGGTAPDEQWLVGAGPAGNQGAVVVAVLADSVLKAVTEAVTEPDGPVATLDVASGSGSSGEVLGAAFPDVRVRFPSTASPAGARRDVRRWFYGVTLLLVLSVTLFGAYFVSRDVRRELRLADLRSRFVSAVSHELKTPLTAIRMYAETLRDRPSDPESRDEYLETIVSESERLTRLLNNILDFARIERGSRQYRPMPDDLAEIVAASARAMRYPLEQHRFRLNLDIHEDLPPVAVDRDAIEQAILNLLSNAMKYSRDTREIDLRLKRVGSEALIEVTDRGFGIAPGERERIFEQFYRTPSVENDGIPGTGLGLTLVRHIAKAHGGDVTVVSVPGRGSTFTLHIPIREGDA